MSNGDDGAPGGNGHPTEHASGVERGKRRLIDRRSYLTAAAAPVVATATATAATTRGGIEFDRAVDDLGCDPTGFRPCQEQIAAAAADGTLVEFPDGADRDGVALVGCEDATVSDTAIDVPGEPLVVRASSVDTADVSFDDCSHGARAASGTDDRAAGAPPAATAERER